MSGLAPSVGCGAAIVDGERILLVKRRRPPEARCWNLPGGKVDFLERAEDAARREVLEETGLVIHIVRLLGLTQMLGQDGQHWVSPVYLAQVVEGEAANLEPDKLEAVAWRRIDDPPSPLAQAAREAIEALRR